MARHPYPPQEHAVPSQAQPRLDAYEPTISPSDVAPTLPPLPLGTTIQGGFVLSTFDARPVQAIDFVLPFPRSQMQAIGPTTGAGQGIEAQATTPQGAVFVARWLSLTAPIGMQMQPPYPVPAPGDQAFIMEISGTLTGGFDLRLDIDIDGAPTPYADMPIDDAIIGAFDIPLYLPIAPSAIVTVRVLQNGAGAYDSFVNTLFLQLGGNLLPSSGAPTDLEPVTKQPVLVKTT